MVLYTLDSQLAVCEVRSEGGLGAGLAVTQRMQDLGGIPPMEFRIRYERVRRVLSPQTPH